VRVNCKKRAMPLNSVAVDEFDAHADGLRAAPLLELARAPAAVRHACRVQSTFEDYNHRAHCKKRPMCVFVNCKKGAMPLKNERLSPCSILSLLTNLRPVLMGCVRHGSLNLRAHALQYVMPACREPGSGFNRQMKIQIIRIASVCIA